MINLMPCRYEGLKNVLVGYAKTGIDLVGFNGKNFFLSACSDDLGLYYFVPKFVRLFGFSLDQAIGYFFYGIIFFSFVFALVGFFLLSKSWLFRSIAAGALSFFWFIALRETTDVYLINVAIVFAVVPLAVYFFRAQKKLELFLVLSGIAIGYAHYIRSFSSFPVFLFLVFGLLFYHSGMWKKKNILLVCLCAGVFLPVVHFRYLEQQRNNFLGAQHKQHESGHVFWHTVLAGLGFLNNDLGLKYDDKTTVEKVYENHPNAIYPTKAYEQAAKQEVFRLVRERFGFVLNTLFAKLGVVFYLLLFFANIGLIFSFFYRKPWILELMFWVGIIFASAPGFIALPGRIYLLGMCAFATVYGLVSIEYALAGGIVQDVMRFLKRKKRARI